MTYDGQNGVFCFATWNVRSIKRTKNFIKVSSIIDKSNADIVCLQETKFGYNEPFEINDYKYVLKHETQKMPYGMGFAIRKSLCPYITVDPNPTERLCSLSMKTDWGNIHIINVYAPPENHETKKKEDFYRQLKENFMVLPDSDYVFLLGDFNAQVGKNHLSWPTCIGEFGVREMNDNGQRLLEFCSVHKLCVTNTYYEGHDENKYTWMNTNRKHSNTQIDLCLIHHEHLKTLIETKSIPMDRTDHLMVTCHVNLSSQNEIKPFFYEPLLNFLIDQCQYLDTERAVEIDDLWKTIRDQLFDSSKIYDSQNYFNELEKFKEILKDLKDKIDTDIQENSLTLEDLEKIVQRLERNIISVRLFHGASGQPQNVSSITITALTRNRLIDLYKTLSTKKKDYRPLKLWENFQAIIFEGNDIISKIKDKLFKTETDAENEQKFQNLKDDITKLFSMCSVEGYCPLEISFVGAVIIYNKDVMASMNDICFGLRCIHAIGQVYYDSIIAGLKDFRPQSKKQSRHSLWECCSKNEILLSINLLQETFRTDKIFIGFFTIPTLDLIENNLFKQSFHQTILKLCLPRHIVQCLFYKRVAPLCTDCLAAHQEYTIQDTEKSCCGLDLILTILTRFVWYFINYRFVSFNDKPFRSLKTTTGELEISGFRFYQHAVKLFDSLDDREKYLEKLEEACEEIGLTGVVSEWLAFNQGVKYKKNSKVNFLDVIFTFDHSQNDEVENRMYKACTFMSQRLYPKQNQLANGQTNMRFLMDVQQKLIRNIEAFTLNSKLEQQLEECFKRCAHLINERPLDMLTLLRQTRRTFYEQYANYEGPDDKMILFREMINFKQSKPGMPPRSFKIQGLEDE